MSRTGNDPSTSKSAKILYRPIGLASSVVGGLLANLVFKKVWQQSAPGDHPDPPDALESGHPLKEIPSQQSCRGSSSRWSRHSSTAAAPGRFSGGAANGPATDISEATAINARSGEHKLGERRGK